MTAKIFNEVTVPCKKFLTDSNERGLGGLITVALYFTDIDNIGDKRSFVANVVKLAANGDILENQAYLGEFNFEVGLVAAKLDYFESDHVNEKVTYRQNEEVNYETGITFYNSLPEDRYSRTPRYMLLEGGVDQVGGGFAYLNTFIHKTIGAKDLMCHHTVRDFHKLAKEYPDVTYYTSSLYRRYCYDFTTELNARRERGDSIETICSYSLYQHIRETRNVDPEIFDTYGDLRRNSRVEVMDIMEDYSPKSKSKCFYMDNYDHYLNGNAVRKFLKYSEGLDYLYDTVDTESDADEIVDLMKSVLTQREEIFAGATDMDIEAFNMIPGNTSAEKIDAVKEILSDVAEGRIDYIPFYFFKTRRMLENEYKENDDLVKQSDFAI